MIEFNFENIHLTAEIISTGQRGINLTVYSNDLNETYLFAWDDKDALLKWKIANSNQLEFININFKDFVDGFVLNNENKIKWIFLNPSPEVKDFETAEDQCTPKLMLFTVFGIWPIFVHYFSTIPRILVNILLNDSLDLKPNEFISNLDNLVKEKAHLLKVMELDVAHLDEEKKEVFIESQFCKYKASINLIVFALLYNGELVKICKNFINEIPVEFLTNETYIFWIEYYIEQTVLENDLEKSLLLIPQESRATLMELYRDFSDSNRKKITDYIENNLSPLAYLMMEYAGINNDSSAILISHLFVYNIAIEKFSRQWTKEYGKYFIDIDGMSLDEAILQFCSIETINPKDTVVAGKFIYYLMDNFKFEKNNRNFFHCFTVFIDKLNSILRIKKRNDFIGRLKKSDTTLKEHSIDAIDLMSGKEFEMFVAELFSKMGYEYEMTKASGDQGIDIIVLKNSIRIGIQVKCYSGSVGNSAIQEAVDGKKHYILDKVMVITNSLFTNSAQELARSNSVILWDRNLLKEKIIEVFNYSDKSY